MHILSPSRRVRIKVQTPNVALWTAFRSDILQYEQIEIDVL